MFTQFCNSKSLTDKEHWISTQQGMEKFPTLHSNATGLPHTVFHQGNCMTLSVV